MGSPACRSPLRAPGRGAAPSGAAPQQVWVGWSQGGCCTGRDPRVVTLRLSLYQGPLGIQGSHPSAGPSPRSAHFTHGPSLLQEIHSGTISGKVGGLGGFLEEVLAKLSLGGLAPHLQAPHQEFSTISQNPHHRPQGCRGLRWRTWPPAELLRASSLRGHFRRVGQGGDGSQRKQHVSECTEHN